MAKKAESLESMIKRGGGVTKHQAIAGNDMNKKKGRKNKKDRKP